MTLERSTTRSIATPQVGLPLLQRAVGHPRREGLVQPDVVPPRERHVVAEPLVRHLVGVDRGLDALELDRLLLRRSEQDRLGPRDEAGVLHGAEGHRLRNRRAGRAWRTETACRSRPRAARGSGPSSRRRSARARPCPSGRRCGSASSSCRRARRRRSRRDRRRRRRGTPAGARSSRSARRGRRPAPAPSETIGVFETALAPAGIVSVSSQGDLYEGSSKQGNARRRVGRLELRVDVPGVAVLLAEDALRGGLVDRARVLDVERRARPAATGSVEGEADEVARLPGRRGPRPR